MTDHRKVLDRFLEIANACAWTRFGEVFTHDIVEEYPQSGEVFRGLANVIATRSQYPGSLPDRGLNAASLTATEEQWLVTPLYSLVRVEDSGNRGTVSLQARYPDGSTWWSVVLYELRGDKICHSTAFFAPLFEAPEWRAPFRETGTAGTSSRPGRVRPDARPAGLGMPLFHPEAFQD